MKRFKIVNNGYDISEVNQFIDVVINRLEKLNEDNNRYLKKIEELKKISVAESKNKTEEKEDISNNTSSINNDNIIKALTAAEETSSRMKELARREAEVLLEDAKRNANAIIQESLIEAQKNEQEAAILKKNIEVYKTRIKAILNSGLDIVDDIDKTDL